VCTEASRLVPKETAILLFYRGLGTDDRGRSLAEVQGLGLSDLEIIHDYIQWLFPLPEPSLAVRTAPILSSGDIETFRKGEELQSALRRSLRRMLEFYGLALSEENREVTVRLSLTFPNRSKVWLEPGNHNYLRITRILRSLNLLGCRKEATAFFTCLSDIYLQNSATIGEETFRYWKQASLPNQRLD
jgi:hypothetical protein